MKRLRKLLRFLVDLCIVAMFIKVSYEAYPAWAKFDSKLFHMVKIQAIEAAWNQREEWARNYPFEGDLISAVPSIILGTLASVIAFSSKGLDVFRRRTPRDNFLSNASIVHIVFPRMDNMSFASISSQHPLITLPSNTPLLPYGDALAGALLISFIHRNKPSVAIKIHHGGDANIPLGESIISIGGNDVNAMTGRIGRISFQRP